MSKLKIIIKYPYFNIFYTRNFYPPVMTIPTTSQKNNSVFWANINIYLNKMSTPVTGITDEVNRCYQPSGYEKYENGGE